MNISEPSTPVNMGSDIHVDRRLDQEGPYSQANRQGVEELTLR